MSDFSNINLSGANIGNLQQGDCNSIYNENQRIVKPDNEDWDILEYELQNIKKNNSNSAAVNEILHMVQEKNTTGIRRIWKDRMVPFIRDILVNLTSEGLIVLFSKILL